MGVGFAGHRRRDDARGDGGEPVALLQLPHARAAPPPPRGRRLQPRAHQPRAHAPRRKPAGPPPPPPPPTAVQCSAHLRRAQSARAGAARTRR
eukprot:scaffold1031_cov461-Prasinococcus_capsulatus_cf.AAC.10